MALPDFLCIGAQKAGTSWLNKNLGQHPEVWMPPVKELHFFDHLFVPDVRRWTKGHIHMAVRNKLKILANSGWRFSLAEARYLVDLATAEPFTLRWYEHAFDHPAGAGKIKGDITPEYSTIGPEGIEYVRTLIPNVRIIYLIRDPYSRAVSQLRMNMTRIGPKSPTTDDWVQFARSPVIAHRGAYSRYVPEWKAAIPEDRILFIPNGEIARSPDAVMRRIERLIGVSEHRYEGLDARVHETSKAKVPEQALRILEDTTRHEREFVLSHFGREFAALT